MIALPSTRFGNVVIQIGPWRTGGNLASCRGKTQNIYRAPLPVLSWVDSLVAGMRLTLKWVHGHVLPARMYRCVMRLTDGVGSPASADMLPKRHCCSTMMGLFLMQLV